MKEPDYFWRAPDLNVYRIDHYASAPNLWCLYMNGRAFYINIYKQACIRKLDEIMTKFKKK